MHTIILPSLIYIYMYKSENPPHQAFWPYLTGFPKLIRFHDQFFSCDISILCSSRRRGNAATDLVEIWVKHQCPLRHHRERVVFCFYLGSQKVERAKPIKALATSSEVPDWLRFLHLNSRTVSLDTGGFIQSSVCTRVLHLTLSRHNDGYYWCQSRPVMEGKCLMLSGLIFSFSPLGRLWGRRLVNLGYFFIFAARKRGFAGRRQGTGFTAPPPRPSVRPSARPSAAPTCGPLKRRLV